MNIRLPPELWHEIIWINKKNRDLFWKKKREVLWKSINSVVLDFVIHDSTFTVLSTQYWQFNIFSGNHVSTHVSKSAWKRFGDVQHLIYCEDNWTSNGRWLTVATEFNLL